ncbi:MAG: DUF6339 family protein [Deltaproteobacteria bacterium]
MKLYPRLPIAVGRKLAAERSALSVEKAAQLSGIGHRTVTYAAVGGQRIDETELEALAARVRDVAVEHGYPERPKQQRILTFDARCATVLHTESEMTPTEAARESVWAFMGCVLLPDIVRWRWGGERTPIDRFSGGERGLRNTLGRLWWRAHLLEDRWWTENDRYELLHILSEDQIVAFVERPRVFMSPLVSVAVAREVISVRRSSGSRTQELDLLRDVSKRFLRMGAFVRYESLNEEEIRNLARRMVNESLVALGREDQVREHHVYYEVARASDSPETPTFMASLREQLSTIDLSSRSSKRFDSVRGLLADSLRMRSETVGVKYIGDAKNAANRVGEALRARPAVVMLLAGAQLTDMALNAARARWSASPSTRFVLVAKHGREWYCSAVLEPDDGVEFEGLARLFPDGTRIVEPPVAEEGSRLATADMARRTRDALLRVGAAGGTTDSIVRGAVALALGRADTSVRSKRVNARRNLGNRLSEGIGAGCDVLILELDRDWLDTAQTELDRQLKDLAKPFLAVLSLESGGARSGWFVWTASAYFEVLSGEIEALNDEPRRHGRRPRPS